MTLTELVDYYCHRMSSSLSAGTFQVSATWAPMPAFSNHAPPGTDASSRAKQNVIDDGQGQLYR